MYKEWLPTPRWCEEIHCRHETTQLSTQDLNQQHMVSWRRIIIAHYVINHGLLWIPLEWEQRILITPPIKSAFLHPLSCHNNTLYRIVSTDTKDSESNLFHYTYGHESTVQLIWSWGDNKASFQSSKDQDFNGGDLQTRKLIIF